MNQLNESQVAALSVLMLNVATVDGVKPSEQALIDSFSAGVEKEISELKYTDKWIEILSTDDEIKELALKMAFITAICDADFTEHEKTYINKVAIELKADDAMVIGAKIEAKSEILSMFPIGMMAEISALLD